MNRLRYVVPTAIVIGLLVGALFLFYLAFYGLGEPQ